MKIIRDIQQIPPLKQPVALTIGNFDGVHLGHQYVLKKLKSYGQSVVVTFENHPHSILKENFKNHSICTLSHKCKLLESQGVDLTLLLPFTEEIKKLSAEKFLEQLHTKIPFSHLVLGYDSVLGNNRQGTKEHIIEIGKSLNVEVEYLKPLIIDEKPVSSSLIRPAIEQGDFEKVKQMMGRDYSIYGPVVRGAAQGKNLGFPTANIDVSELILPPLGVYAVVVEFESKQLKAIANLGVAPTMRESNIPILEIHLLDDSQDLYGIELNVIFIGFIRPEMRFPDVDALKSQIKADIEKARAMGLRLNLKLQIT